MDINVIMNLINSWVIILIPLTTGLTEAIKKVLPEEVIKKYTPILSILIASACSILLLGASRQNTVMGVIIGLSASGLWSTVTNPFKKSE